MAKTRIPHKAPTFTHAFLDTDTITVRNLSGVSVTFSIQTDVPIERHDLMLKSILADGWGKLHLVLHEPTGVDESVKDPRDRRDNVVDSSYTPELIKKWFGVEWQEFRLMYKYARLQIITAIEERFSALARTN